MNKKKGANTALCYVRLSFSLNPDAENSPQRQKSNIESMCKQRGWDVEMYEDVGGHKSGTTEQGRSEWLKLKKRLKDPDVVALVANDLSRLHRKNWRVSQLVDQLEKLNIALVLAAPDRQVDTSTPQGRMFVQFTAVIDEYYATDISVRAKDNIRYRKSQGKSIGMPPFGTIRDDKGYLMPSMFGTWLLPNGRFMASEVGEEIPVAGAIWRGYYEACHRILEVYAMGQTGINKVAYKLNDEGWAYRTRKGEPRTITSDDVRRVIANWAEYGGLVLDEKAKDRKVYNEDETSYILDPNRAVFPIELLLQVAKVRKERTHKPKNDGVNRKVRSYPLSGLTYCAHCEALATEQKSLKLRTRFNGAAGNGILRYRHKPGVICGCSNRSVPTEEYEADFRRLLTLLTIDENSIDLMMELAILSSKADSKPENKERLEQQKNEAIARCNRRIDGKSVV